MQNNNDSKLEEKFEIHSITSISFAAMECEIMPSHLNWWNSNQQTIEKDNFFFVVFHFPFFYNKKSFFMTTFHFISSFRFRLENKLSRFRLTMLFSFLDSVSLVSRTFFFNFFFNFFFQSDFIFLGCVFPLHHFSLTFASSPSSSSSWKHIWLKLVDRK